MISKEELDCVLPGCRVLAFDPTLYKDDLNTPLSHTVRPATVLQRYGIIGYESTHSGWVLPHPDVVDLRFDHRPERVSRAHFTKFLKGVAGKHGIFSSK